MSRIRRKPITGVAFETEHTNLEGNIALYLRELQYYGPRRFATLIKEGNAILRDLQPKPISMRLKWRMTG